VGTPANKKPRQQPLRDRQKQLTRDLIMRAVADIVTERGVHSFTVQEVADRAGVSHRSVYRHFPTREALLEELYEWGDQLMDVPGALGVPSSLDDLPGMAERLFALFDSSPHPVKAMAVAMLTMDMSPRTRVERDAVYTELLSQAASNLGFEARQRAFAVLKYLFSPQAWLFLRERHSLTGEEAGRAIAWALSTLIDDLKQGNAAAGPGGRR